MSRSWSAGLLCIVLVCSATVDVAAQGRWDFSLGKFDGRGDDASSRGAVGMFTRWRGPEKAFQKGGPRLVVIWSAQDQTTVQPTPTFQFRVTGKRAMWAVAVGVPYRATAMGLPVRPFLEAAPGVAMYRSVDLTRFTDVTNGHVNVINRTRWLLGPSVDLAGGLQIPGSNHGPRLHLRAAVRTGWLLGSEAVGSDPNGLWHIWELSAGGAFPF